MRLLWAVLLLAVVISPAWADPVALNYAVAVGTTSAQVIPQGDQSTPGRSCVNVTNSGPNVAFCAFGTKNAVTTANGVLLLIGETLTYCSQLRQDGKVALPPQTDLSCIGFNGGGNTTANIIATDW